MKGKTGSGRTSMSIGKKIRKVNIEKGERKRVGGEVKGSRRKKLGEEGKKEERRGEEDVREE